MAADRLISLKVWNGTTWVYVMVVDYNKGMNMIRRIWYSPDGSTWQN